ncbi:hypothetical protein [Pseudomonas leptonychotis]|uniref:hypothetical protein n=1 Tax=Pseudomonas leptonychotis TaxID=2448482 RepID=UPI003865A826
MSDLGSTTLVKIGDKEVICRELTVAGVRQLIAAPGAGELIMDALFPDLRLGDLPALTSLSAADIETMRPSELAHVIDGCKKANPDFFAMLARLKVQTQA